MSTKIDKYTDNDLTPILDFYNECGYGGGADLCDEIWVAIHKDRIIGVTRVCREQEFLVLRGMFIASEYRRKGIGTRFLGRIEMEISEKCYCLPYTNLERFYSQMGFRRTADKALPPFFKARLDGYRQKGLDVIGMERQAHNKANAVDRYSDG